MIKIGVFQMTSVRSLEQNKEWILNQLYSHDLSNVKYLFFPENSLSFKINDDDGLEAVQLDDPFWNELISLCKTNDLEIQISAAVESKGVTYNSSFWVTEEGLASFYNKIHLFKVFLPSKVVDESKTFQKGEVPVIHTSKNNLRFGASICFDLRFPNLYQYYAEQKVDVITVPSAFLQRTGKDHWHTLLKARAIETQSYVVASAQSGHHLCEKTGNIRKTWGHSLVVDPWGNVILDASEEAGFFTCYLDTEILKKTRSILPLDRSFKG